MSESTTSCSLLLRCFEEQGSGQFSHYFFFFLKKKSLPKFLVNVISLWDIWGGGREVEEAALLHCTRTEGFQKASEWGPRKEILTQRRQG